MAGFFSFPNPVNETSARVVAGGVVGMAGTALAFDQPWLLFPLAYGFAARVASGPKFSPLGLLATKLVTPKIPIVHRFSPGPPKRLAQAIGFTLSATALLLHYGFGRPRAAKQVLSVLLAAAALEAGLGICLACKMFAVGMKVGVVPEAICEECNDIWRRYGTTAA
ncbi:MAG TPA: DUF4395 domain-containing protein [Acidimicrobiales bacterium]